MKKILGLTFAAFLLCGFAGHALASFTNGDVIRVVYDNELSTGGGTYEYATDLGSLTSLLADPNGTIITGSGFTPSTLSQTLYENLQVTYYVAAYSGSPLTKGKIYIAGGAAAPQVQSANQYPSLSTLSSFYRTGTLSGSSTLVDQSSLSSYWNTMNGGGAYIGAYNQFLPGGSAEANLSPLATGGKVTMNLYVYNAANVSSGTQTQGILLANNAGNVMPYFFLTTLVDTKPGAMYGEAVTMVNPIPPSLFLLAPGLFGLIGLRRKVHKA